MESIFLLAFSIPWLFAPDYWPCYKDDERIPCGRRTGKINKEDM
jgi:hypothetical protein